MLMIFFALEIDVCWWGCQLQEVFFFKSPGAIKYFNDWRRSFKSWLGKL